MDFGCEFVTTVVVIADTSHNLNKRPYFIYLHSEHKSVVGGYPTVTQEKKLNKSVELKSSCTHLRWLQGMHMHTRSSTRDLAILLSSP